MARGSDGRFALGCGGDTFNTAVYLARAGIPTAFATALGDDPLFGRHPGAGGGRRRGRAT